MVLKKISRWIVASSLFVMPLAAQQSSLININLDKPVADVSSTMWGVFFEDINFAADGGLYAEMVKNRSFEFYQPLMGWTELKNTKSSLLINNRQGNNSANPRYAQITVFDNDGSYGISNSGFRGMGVKKDLKYHFYILAKQEASTNVSLKIELVDSLGTVIGTASLSPQGTEWKEYAVDFVSSETNSKAKLNLWFEGKGIIDIDMVSLFPDDTWKHRPKGLRNDLVQLLADMKPGFLRFPGGCIVEGRELATRYQWKKTIGKIEDRQMIVNRWNTEFAHKLTPDYFQTFGLGFFEYFQLCEDLGAEPLPILNCGMACQFNSSEVIPLDQLDPYIQDILDLIEFANGNADSEWGKIRVAMGHPEPFHLKMLGVGNEQWGQQYLDRLKLFVKVLKEKHPEITLVSDPGPSPDGEMFDFLWTNLKTMKADIVDEHYYKAPKWFRENANRYDNYDRKGPKVFAGEYAAQSVAIASPDNKNNWECALSEAAFMTGLERNGEVVRMCSYAPLLAHVEGWQWTPDLIWFDNLKSYGSANYYVQKMFSNNKGTQILSATINNEPVEGKNDLFVSVVLDKVTKTVIIKAVNTSGVAHNASFNCSGVLKLSGLANVTVLKNSDIGAVNTMINPSVIKPTEYQQKIEKKSFELSLEPYSFSVIRIPFN
jgi:alpha-L-arabinofuranosidase